MRDMVLILNFDPAGSRAVARTLRAEHVYCKIVPPAITAQEVREQAPLGLVLAGGVTGAVPAAPDGELLTGEWPVLALGDAACALCRALGGEALEVAIGSGVSAVSFTRCTLTEGLDDCERALRAVRRLRLPDSLRVLAVSQEETVGFLHESLPLYGVQFALEQNDTDGTQLVLGFALNVCGCTRWWDEAAFVSRAVEEISRVVGKGRAVCAMTGGLSSGITALLAHQALGERLQCVFIDTGLMRENEAARFLAFYRDQLGLPIAHVQGQDRFLAALAGVSDPAEKRRIIGTELQATLSEAVSGLGHFDVILRSTTCNDVLNGEDYRKRPGIRGEQPVVEPLRELFKDEVRRVGAHLGLPEEVLQRPTFPGSGLALRILGEVTPARLQSVRAADQIFDEEISAAGQSKRLGQHFAVLSPLPVDDAHAQIILRAVNAGETLTYAARPAYDLLERVTERILRERPEVSRVVYDLTPATRRSGVEWQ